MLGFGLGEGSYIFESKKKIILYAKNISATTVWVRCNHNVVMVCKAPWRQVSSRSSLVSKSVKVVIVHRASLRRVTNTVLGGFPMGRIKVPVLGHAVPLPSSVYKVQRRAGTILT